MMLQACLNGGLSRKAHARVPESPRELAEDARLARTLGVEALHVHPRGADGRESVCPEDVVACLKAISEAVPGMPVGVGTGIWIRPTGTARLRLIERWSECPDYASVNLNEPDASETMAILRAKGIGIEAGLWSRSDAERFVALGLPACTRVLIEMPDGDPVAVAREYGQMMAILVEAAYDGSILLHGEGKSAWTMVALARTKGHDTRIGLEDTQTLPDGRPVTGNGDLIAAAAAILWG
ncbi:MAG: 3-keto-5-aminohexanoate cleavage protein [Rhodospirillum sp.]|nr:3-keto-5-aminohexanoate cleavage protein [Rhodospirillum sp.]MCF8490721.1 3-keto-5-aminohexanoate cleavage protein [Rhodospirillum sp.]MCF8499380.1 3-keto-5-aminohexanoate cleavage protein [Rhodospirillum sp.]